MDLPALQTIPLMHENRLARLGASPWWHSTRFAPWLAYGPSSQHSWPMVSTAPLSASQCLHGTAIGINIEAQGQTAGRWDRRCKK